MSGFEEFQDNGGFRLACEAVSSGDVKWLADVLSELSQNFTFSISTLTNFPLQQTMRLFREAFLKFSQFEYLTLPVRYRFCSLLSYAILTVDDANKLLEIADLLLRYDGTLANTRYYQCLLPSEDDESDEIQCRSPVEFCPLTGAAEYHSSLPAQNEFPSILHFTETERAEYLRNMTQANDEDISDHCDIKEDMQRRQLELKDLYFEMPPLVALIIRAQTASFDTVCPFRKLFDILIDNGADIDISQSSTYHPVSDAVMWAAIMRNPTVFYHVLWRSSNVSAIEISEQLFAYAAVLLEDHIDSLSLYDELVLSSVVGCSLLALTKFAPLTEIFNDKILTIQVMLSQLRITDADDFWISGHKFELSDSLEYSCQTVILTAIRNSDLVSHSNNMEACIDALELPEHVTVDLQVREKRVQRLLTRLRKKLTDIMEKGVQEVLSDDGTWSYENIFDGILRESLDFDCNSVADDSLAKLQAELDRLDEEEKEVIDLEPGNEGEDDNASNELEDTLDENALDDSNSGNEFENDTLDEDVYEDTSGEKVTSDDELEEYDDDEWECITEGICKDGDENEELQRVLRLSMHQDTVDTSADQLPLMQFLTTVTETGGPAKSMPTSSSEEEKEPSPEELIGMLLSLPGIDPNSGVIQNTIRFIRDEQKRDEEMNDDGAEVKECVTADSDEGTTEENENGVSQKPSKRRKIDNSEEGN